MRKQRTTKHPEVLEVHEIPRVEDVVCRSCKVPLPTEDERKRVPILGWVLCHSCANLGTQAAVGALELGKRYVAPKVARGRR